MKRILPLMLVLALLCTSAVAFAESEEPITLRVLLVGFADPT